MKVGLNPDLKPVLSASVPVLPKGRAVAQQLHGVRVRVRGKADPSACGLVLIFCILAAVCRGPGHHWAPCLQAVSALLLPFSWGASLCAVGPSGALVSESPLVPLSSTRISSLSSLPFLECRLQPPALCPAPFLLAQPFLCYIKSAFPEALQFLGSPFFPSLLDSSYLYQTHLSHPKC